MMIINLFEIMKGTLKRGRNRESPCKKLGLWIAYTNRWKIRMKILSFFTSFSKMGTWKAYRDVKEKKTNRTVGLQKRKKETKKYWREQLTGIILENLWLQIKQWKLYRKTKDLFLCINTINYFNYTNKDCKKK